MMRDRPSPNYDTRPPGCPVDTLVLHYTGMRSAEAAIERLCDPAAKVSAHYLIDEDGTVLKLVDEAHRAWHAGVSFWRGHRDINARSIGIELVNPGHEFGYRTFPDAQMAALTSLARAIVGRYPIPARNVLGHSDVAPDRKTDPGELFDWQGLAAAGVGLWPRPADPGARSVEEMLTAYGYDPSAQHVVAAFQRHFRSSRVDGVADRETARLLAGLLATVE